MSIWNYKLKRKKYKTLNKNIEVDTLIIGAGITGITLGYYLNNLSNVIIVDANKIGYGVTLNSTAKINYFQGNINKIANITDDITAQKYLESQIYAVDLIKNIIEKEKIDCDFKRVDSYLFANKKKDIKDLKNEIKILLKNKINVKEKKLNDRVNSYKSYYVKDTYTFNPLKYLYSLKKIINSPIYENTKITKIKKRNNKYICYSDKYIITTKKVILACQYPFSLFDILLPLKSYIEKSYIIVSKVKYSKDITYISLNNPIYSSRYYKINNVNYQICLGESHNVAFKQNDNYHFKKLQNDFNIKDSDIVMKYTNVDVITPDYMPYIGLIKENFYVSLGYNTWGISNGVLGAKVISDMLLNKKNKYINFFNPKRISFSNVLKFPMILVSQIKSYIMPKIIKNKYWYEDNIKFINKDGKNLAIYKDSSGFKHTIINKCPHLGCSLIFNSIDKTWDCPCHASRFTIDGKCIKGPSTYDISYDK